MLRIWEDCGDWSATAEVASGSEVEDDEERAKVIQRGLMEGRWKEKRERERGGCSVDSIFVSFASL